MQEITAIFITIVVLAIIASPVALIFVAARRSAKQLSNIGKAADKYLKTE